MRDILLIFCLALLWLAGGAIVSLGLRAYLGVEWLMPCTSLSLLLGMILLLVVMRDEQARRRLFGETDEEMPFKLSLAALIIVPIFFITTGLLWLLTAPLFTK